MSAKLYLLNAGVYRIRTRTVSYRRAIWNKARMAFVLPTGMAIGLDDVKFVGQRGSGMVSIDDCHLATAVKLPTTSLTKKQTRARRILDILDALPGATTGEIASRLGVPSNHVSAGLHTLSLQGAVRSNTLRIPGDTWTVRRQWWRKGAPRAAWYQRVDGVAA